MTVWWARRPWQSLKAMRLTTVALLAQHLDKAHGFLPSRLMGSWCSGCWIVRISANMDTSKFARYVWPESWNEETRAESSHQSVQPSHSGGHGRCSDLMSFNTNEDPLEFGEANHCEGCDLAQGKSHAHVAMTCHRGSCKARQGIRQIGLTLQRPESRINRYALNGSDSFVYGSHITNSGRWGLWSASWKLLTNVKLGSGLKPTNLSKHNSACCVHSWI